MEITVIGPGNMGRAITIRAIAGKHSVTLLGTETAKAEAVADEVSGDVRPGRVGDPLTDDVVVLAVWYAAVDDLA
jgi:8-hydroxy-5-deazaflavin:NADPH oxidoreductase